MHKHIITLLPLIFIACTNPSAPEKESSEQSYTMSLPADAVALQTIDGDFDGDGAEERAEDEHHNPGEDGAVPAVGFGKQTEEVVSHQHTECGAGV